MSRLLSRTLGVALAGLFLVSLLPSPAAATAGVPYCYAASHPLANVPGVDQSEVCLQVSGRIFPEASPHSQDPSCMATTCRSTALDFVSLPEFQDGLNNLAGKYPDFLTVHEVAQSFGLCPTPSQDPNAACTTGLDHFPIYMLEITNKASPIPIENRQSMLFMLSIHGVEKGGREGGFRVLEDLVSNIGFATETVQDGAGMPSALEKPTGGPVQTYRDYLDFQRIFLLFPNSDGWMHDEAPYVVTGGTCGGNGNFMCRTNGNKVDLNRQAPTSGWQNPNRHMVGEPESIGYYNWMLTQDITWNYAIDVHGMGQHRNFGAIMMPAGAMTPQEMQRSIRLAETLKDRLNTDPHFDEWRTLFTTAGTADGATGPVDMGCDNAGSQVPDPLGPVDCPLPGSALAGVGSTEFAEYSTVIDAIGYTDSGFNGDYFAQDSGLNAPGYDIELAYNHAECDSRYTPCQLFVDYHVKMVREIVKSFMDAAALDVRISFETRGLRTAYVESSFVATSADDTNSTPGGWADENPGDDLWDYGKNGGFTTRPARYFEDLKPFVRNGVEPGVLTKLTGSSLTASALATYDSLVIPGSAIRDLEGSPAKIQAIKEWTEAGGNLVLTDESLRFFELAGIVPAGGVNLTTQYMGGIGITDLDLPVFYEYQDTSSDANRNVRGGVKQTYEPTPLGFETGARAAPNWGLKPDALAAVKGEAWGTACGSTSINDRCPGGNVGLGRVKLGAGEIQFIGALLPDPTEEFYHPYGLDPYATTYSGNQMLRNMLYWGNVLDSPPVVIDASGEIIQSNNEPDSAQEAGAAAPDDKKDTPGLGLAAVLAALAAIALVRRRR